MRKNIFPRQSIYTAGAILTLGLALGACSDSEPERGSATEKGDGPVLKFSSDNGGDGTALSRAVGSAGKLLSTSAIQIEDSLFLLDKEEEWLVNDAETSTTEQAKTRAAVTTLSTLGDFSSFGYSGTSMSDLTLWFYERKSDADGVLYTETNWASSKPFGLFYGISPVVSSTGSGISNLVQPTTFSASSVPTMDFTVNTNGLDQKDLLIACSPASTYYDVSAGTADNVPLNFQHALTQIRFKKGYALRANSLITNVTIKNVYSKGTLSFPTDQLGTDMAWSGQTASTTFSMNIGTGTNPNINTGAITDTDGIMLGTEGDVYSFFMLPQALTSSAEIVVTLRDISTNATRTITVTPTGTWRPGTRRTYTLNDTASDYEYHFDETEETFNVAYNTTSAGNFNVTSYRTFTDYTSGSAVTTSEPVSWAVDHYEEYDHATKTWVNKALNRPSWITSLSAESGTGGTTAQQVSASLKAFANNVDMLAAYNAQLKATPAVGQGGTPYNLANPANPYTDDVVESANSYLISAPGTYRIPLAYGNGIKNNNSNSSAYTFNGVLSGTEDNYVLKKFLNHAGDEITSGWIEDNNVTVADARIVWASRQNVVSESSFNVNGKFLEFTINNTIENGNAVIAATASDGTVVWSWHLWFGREDELTNRKVITNNSGMTYTIPANNLGTEYFTWTGTEYEDTLKARVVLKPTFGSTKSKTVNINKAPNQNKVMYSTTYQWGRKDAFPTTYTNIVINPQSEFVYNATAGDMSLVNSIKHPAYFYLHGNKWRSAPNATNPGTGPYTFKNLWNANNTAQFNTTNVYAHGIPVKTIYDPSPAGWTIPGGSTFTGLTAVSTHSDGNRTAFWTDNTHKELVWFPRAGCRYFDYGSINDVGDFGYLWLSAPFNADDGGYAYFHSGLVSPQHSFYRSSGYSVRPVLDN